MDEEVLNHYCWMYSTFDIPEDFMVSYREKGREDITKKTFKNLIENEKCVSTDHLMPFAVTICQKSLTFLSKVFLCNPLNGMPRDVHVEF